MPSIVQFFHPGKEHGYDKEISNNGKLIKNWNNTAHRRKFLLNEGSYIKDGQRNDGKLLFWGEWEPPSRVEILKEQTYCPPYGINPVYLHTPFLPSNDQIEKYQKKIIKNENQEDVHLFQNTDPFVFGKNFIYAICLQKMESLRALEKGSLIIFGSRVNCRFVIDTIFVVKEAEPYSSLEDIEKMNLGKYKDIVTKFILNKNDCLNEPIELILYKGATFDSPENGMYSFVPAKVYSGKKIGFPRFFMPDEFYKPENNNFNKYFAEWEYKSGKIYERKTQGIKNTEVNYKEIYNFWEYLRNKISKDHVLGYNFKMPEMDEDFKYRNENDIFLLSVKGKSGCN
jgi:hypothetical protein